MRSLSSPQAPLRGRASLTLMVQPFDYRAAAEFWGLSSNPDAVFQMHALVGGTPAYRMLSLGCTPDVINAGRSPFDSAKVGRDVAAFIEFRRWAGGERMRSLSYRIWPLAAAAWWLASCGSPGTTEVSAGADVAAPETTVVESKPAETRPTTTAAPPDERWRVENGKDEAGRSCVQIWVLNDLVTCAQVSQNVAVPEVIMSWDDLERGVTLVVGMTPRGTREFTAISGRTGEGVAADLLARTDEATVFSLEVPTTTAAYSFVAVGGDGTESKTEAAVASIEASEVQS
jgi:hypothetical protein